MQVVGGNLGRRHQHTSFAFVGGFHTAVEEERYVSIFFRFGNTKLSFATLSKVFAKGVFQLFGFVGDVHADKFFVVLRHAHPVHFACLAAKVKAVKAGLSESTGNFASAIGTEIEEDYRIAVFDGRNGFAVFHNDGRQHKFVGHACLVAGFECRNGVLGGVYALAESQHIVGFFLAIPTVVAVHCVVTSANGSHLAEFDFLHLGLQLLDEACAACRGNVTSVHVAMYVNVTQTLLFGKVQQCFAVIDVGVHAAVAHKTHYVQFAARLFDIVDRVQKCGVGEEIAVGNALCNARQLLVNNTSCTHV